jgi:hypothetical protein
MSFALGPLPSVPQGMFSGFGSVAALQAAENNTGSPPVTLSNPPPSTAPSSSLKTSNPLTSLGSVIGAFSNITAPFVYSPNELFDPLYWQVLTDNALASAQAVPTTQLGILQNTAVTGIINEDETLLAQKYGPGGPSNYMTLLGKFGTYILFGIIFIVLIYAFVSGEGNE